MPDGLRSNDVDGILYVLLIPAAWHSTPASLPTSPPKELRTRSSLPEPPMHRVMGDKDARYYAQAGSIDRLPSGITGSGGSIALIPMSSCESLFLIAQKSI